MRRMAAPVFTLLAAFGLVLASPLAASRGAGAAAPIVVSDPLKAASQPPAASGAPLAVMLELTAPLPNASGISEGNAAALAAVAHAQSELVTRLQALHIPILFTTHAAYNGVAVLAVSAQLDALRALPGLAGVHVITPKQRATTSAAATGAAQFWSSLGQHILGQGVRIGIIDSGVDYTHATFGGPGTPAAFSSNNPVAVEPGSFPTVKVTGGVDFVGETYDASGAQGSPIPTRDDDPLDCGGHGTQVASIAAGFGVDSAGATFHGPYAAETPFDQFAVPPGVAPEASIVALKIFGCHGTTAFLTQAIDYALDPNGDGNTADRLVDVLNISLGSPFAGEGDPDAVAVDRAARAGVVVVVSAGGAGDSTATGDVFYSVASPATTPLAIAVGASATETGVTRVASFSPRGPALSGALKPDLIAPGVDVGAAAIGSGNGVAPLSGTSAAAPQVAGAAALLHQLHPGWSPTQIKDALMNSAAPVGSGSAAVAPPSLAGSGSLDIARLAQLDLLAYASDDPAAAALSYGAPALAGPVTLHRDLTIENTGSLPRFVQLEAVTAASENGVQLELPTSSLSIAPGARVQVPVNLTVQPALLDNTPDEATALRQSQGLYRYYLAEHSGYVQITSSATTRVRFAFLADAGDVDVRIGGAPLGVRLRRADLSGYVAINPGTQVVEVRRAGSSATSAPIFSGPITIEEGRDHTAVLWGCGCHLRLAPLIEKPSDPPAGTGLVTFHNSYPYNQAAVDVYAGDTLIASGVPQGELVTLPVPAGTYTFRALHAGDAPSRTPVSTKRAAVVAGQQFLLSLARAPLWTRLASSGGEAANRQRLRVPFLIFPRSASQSTASATSYQVPGGVSQFDIPLQNGGARNAPLDATSPRSQVALVSAFALDPRGVSPESASLPPLTRFADLEYAGATSNYMATRDASSPDTYLYFGIASRAAWASPNQLEFRVYVDTDGDNTPDYLILTASRAALAASPPNAGPPDDVFITALYSIPPGQAPQYTGQRTDWNTLSAPTALGFETEGLDPAPFNTRVLFVAARAPSLGLSASHTRLRYYVETLVRDARGFTNVADRVPQTGLIDYDMAGDAVTPMNLTIPALQQRPVFVASAGALLTTTVNQAALGERGAQALLLLHHHNPAATQAQVVLLSSTEPLGLRANPALVRAVLPIVGQR